MTQYRQSVARYGEAIVQVIVSQSFFVEREREREREVCLVDVVNLLLPVAVTETAVCV